MRMRKTKMQNLSSRDGGIMLSYDDYVTIKITKVKDEFGNFAHWEADNLFSNNSYGSGSTGPTFLSVLDTSLDQIRETAQYWMSSDANRQ